MLKVLLPKTLITITTHFTVAAGADKYTGRDRNIREYWIYLAGMAHIMNDLKKMKKAFTQKDMLLNII